MGSFDQTPLIVAHRGFRAKYPENTLTAFRAAEAAGAPAVELDVALTRDRQVVVLHDDTVDRTTDGKGAVARMTLDKLKRLDAGSWFDTGFAGERIPTLAEVLDGLAPETGINIEIKGSAVEADFPSDALERQVVGMIKERDAYDRVLVSSFDANALTRVRALDRWCRIGLLSPERATDLSVTLCKRLDAASWHPDHRKVDKKGIKRMHAAGLRILPYTVNDPVAMARLLDQGVDGLITDDPVSALQLCDKRN